MAEVSKDHTRERPIQRVLRHKRSREYFTGNGWTGNLDEARMFEDALQAAQTCVRCGLSEVEMVLRVKGGTADLYCTEL